MGQVEGCGLHIQARSITWKIRSGISILHPTADQCRGLTAGLEQKHLLDTATRLWDCLQEIKSRCFNGGEEMKEGANIWTSSVGTLPPANAP